MAVSISTLKRVFVFGDNILPDPDAILSPAEVLDFYSSKYPELATGSIKSIEEENGELVHKVSISVGDKA